MFACLLQVKRFFHQGMVLLSQNAFSTKMQPRRDGLAHGSLPTRMVSHRYSLIKE